MAEILERRKVQKTGGSTYTVSLPKNWAEKYVEKGDYVNILKQNNSLEISVESGSSEPLSKTLDYEEEIDELIRNITAHYLAGYDVLNITSPGKIDEKEQVEKEIRKRLTGVESTPADNTRIELKNLLDMEEMPTRQILRRCKSITESSFDEVIAATAKSGSVDISGRENEIDRLYMLGVRQINAAVENPEIRQKLGIESGLTCIEYRLGFRFIERVSDRLEEIGRDEKERSETFTRVMKKLFDNYSEVTEALIKQDGDEAENSIKKAEHIKEEIESEEKLEDKHHLKRITAMNIDLAELAINLSAVHNQERYETNQLKN